MEVKLLTIIIPTYNMEAYLDLCLSSLIVCGGENDMMSLFEVLVINDGSTDSSSEIAHDFENRYPSTFKVVDKENGNYGSCINTALPLAKGKYVKILDADDWFDTDVFVEYLIFLQGVDVDMVYTPFDKVKSNVERWEKHNIIAPHNEVLLLKDYPSIYKSLWMHSTTYKRSVFEGLDYHQTEGIFYTDLEWIYLPMSRVVKFAKFPQTLYLYFTGRPDQTVTAEAFDKNYKMRFECLYSLINTYLKCCNEGGKYNGLDVNMDYLHSRCLTYAEELYFNLLANQRTAKYANRLQELDNTIYTRFPVFIKKLDNLVLSNPFLPRIQMPFHIIRCWHKYGPNISIIQMWFVNHYLGLSSRVAKMLHN